MIRYFGPPQLCKSWEQLVPTPVGMICMLCGEQVREGDIGTINMSNQITHYECDLRMVIGSVGHQNGLCSCHGGTEEDPPGMTRREAARAAAALWESRQGYHHLSPLLRHQADDEAAPQPQPERNT